MFRSAMRAAMTSAASAPDSAMYSSACFRHCVTLSEDFWKAPLATAYAGSVTFAESFSEWAERGYSGGIFDMEHCRGFNCGCRKAQAWNDMN